jgi:hypothetical protein
MCEDAGALRSESVPSFLGEGLEIPEASITTMPRKRKKKVFSAAKIVREMARERVGSPKPSRLVPAKKTKPERHKTTLGKLLTEE